MGVAPVDARQRLILALDVSSIAEARNLICELRDYVGMFKIGLELFSQAGTAVFDLMRELNIKLFFDCKFLDIPNTVAGASRAVASQGVAMFNVHATGGTKMIKAAAEACQKASAELALPCPKLLAVTILTSLDQNWLTNELGVSMSVSEKVCQLAKLAADSGAAGVVASPLELPDLRRTCGKDFLLVTPGVRPHDAARNDQSRVVTPYKAIVDGADYLVIGRPITGASDRKQATKKILAEMEEALGVSVS